MPTFTSFWRSALLFLSYFALDAHLAAAQGAGMQSAATVASASQTTTTVPELAVDDLLNTAAVLQPRTVALGAGEGASERVQFKDPIKPGLGSSYIYIKVNKLVRNTLSSSALNGSTVKAYLNGTQVGSWPLGGLLQLSVFEKEENATMTITPRAEFNQLELNLDAALSGYSVNLYEAYAPAPPAPLPVQLVSFQAKASAGGVCLSWTTASELNNHHFTVERASGSAASTFVALGQVAGAGTSSRTHNYQFTDATSAGTSYYRLRQVDASGTANFSAVVAVQAVPQAPLTAYPSPATTSLTVASATGATLRIFNQQGQLVRQVTLPAGSQTLDVSALAAGFYVLQDANSGQRLRIQKMD